MANNATRRPLHCFNILRQIKVLKKAGMGSTETQMKDMCECRACFPMLFLNSVLTLLNVDGSDGPLLWQDWKNAAGLAKAFSLGKMESDAVFALSTDVPEPICSDLERLVTTRGMGRFLHHDVIGKGTFSKGWTSGVGLAESWSEPLTNLPRDFTLATRREFLNVILRKG